MSNCSGSVFRHRVNAIDANAVLVPLPGGTDEEHIADFEVPSDRYLTLTFRDVCKPEEHGTTV